MKRIFVISLLLFCGVLQGASMEEQLLVGALSQPKFWSGVHAAEYLMELNRAGFAVDGFILRQKKSSDEPVTRIGLWRVTALRCRKTGREDEYERTLTLIRSIAFADENPTDRIHAVETLFKLRYFCNEEEQRRLRHFCGDEECPALLKIYSAALLAWSSPEEGAGNLTRLFRQYRDDASCRLVMLVVLQNFARLPDELLKEIAEVQSNAKYAASRVAASRILLKHRRLQVEQVLTDLPPSAEAMRLLLEFAPKSRKCQAMIRLLKKSDSLELRMLVAFAKLSIE